MKTLHRGLICCMLLLLPCLSFGHSESGEYLINSQIPDEAAGYDIISETSLFLVPLSEIKDLYTRFSDFNFSSVRYQRRGYDMSIAPIYLDNIELTNNITSSVDYSLWNALRRGRAVESSLSGSFEATQNFGVSGIGKQLYGDLYKSAQRTRLNLYMLDRRARGGGYLNSTGEMGKRWRYSASVWGRWGRDPKIKGVFSDEISYVFNLCRQFGERHALSLLAIGSARENGLRNYVTKETLSLADDNFYNPAWGRYEGKERNSRVVKRHQPLLMAKYSANITDNTKLLASLSYRFGENKISGLSWFDASTPYPDYYRSLPSYIESPLVQDIVKDAWSRGDEKITQIDWESMMQVNMNQPAGVAYVLQDRVERVSDIEYTLHLSTKVANRVELQVGFNVRRENTHYYKEVKDLLMGKPFEDIDPFWKRQYGDEAKYNDLQTVGREIAKGDKFGYNYTMVGSRYGFDAIASYKGDRVGLLLGLKLGQTSFMRDGKFENGLFPETGSLGKSAKKRFTTYELSVAGEYYISPRHYLRLSGGVQRTPPRFGAVFLSPDISNKMIDNPKASSFLGVEAEYGATMGRFQTKVVGYYATQRDETALYRYYDDIDKVYSNMVVRDINKRYWGVEFTAQYEITSRWNISAIFGANDNKYSTDQRIDLLNDATKRAYLSGATSYLKDYKIGGSPQLTTSAELKYNSFGWIGSITYSFMGNRFMTPNPLWRMQRVFNLTSSPEIFSEFTEQERLPSVGVVNLFLLKSFFIGNNSLTLTISVNNLFDREVIYSGYEQMRVHSQGSGATTIHLPFDNKYQYSYGRSFYASLTFSF